MDPITSKKLRERFFLDRFLERLGVIPTWIQERERPDFLVHLEGRTVGVEITYLHIRDTPENTLPQAMESVTDRIVSAAQRLYSSSGAPPAHVTVLFSSWLRFNEVKREQIAKRLANHVQSLDLNTWQKADWRSDAEENDDHPLSDVVDVIHALGVPDHSMAHWTVARAGWVATLTAERLQERIDEKSPKVATYQKVAQEIWLVVIADGMKPSQAFLVPSDLEAHAVVSPFTKTFFFGHPTGTLVELGVRIPQESRPLEL